RVIDCGQECAGLYRMEHASLGPADVHHHIAIPQKRLGRMTMSRALRLSTLVAMSTSALALVACTGETMHRQPPPSQTGSGTGTGGSGSTDPTGTANPPPISSGTAGAGGIEHVPPATG